MSNVRLETARKLDISGVKNVYSQSKTCGMPQGRRFRSYSTNFSSGTGNAHICPAHRKSFSEKSENIAEIMSSTTAHCVCHPKLSGPNTNSNVNFKSPQKRRHGSFSDWSRYGSAGQFKRRKKDSVMVPPTKFLLGGNINDPLNLNSLADSELGRAINQVTPETSPLPIPKHRTKVQVLIPPNINDPLNLNAGEEDAELELNLISPKTKKRKKRRKKKHSSGDVAGGETTAKDKSGNEEKNVADRPNSLAIKIGFGSDGEVMDSNPAVIPPQAVQPRQKKADNKIVSPVIPQPGMRKHRPSGHSRSISRDFDVQQGTSNVASGTEPWVKQKKHANRKSRSTSCKRRNDEFKYGNFSRYYGYRNPELGEDARLSCLKKEWFQGKDVLDVGCNTGHFTLNIARDLNPKKVIGLDIDHKLVRMARKNVIYYMKDQNTGLNQFPISMPICHGPITTAAVLNDDERPRFPNNVFFLQANYILESDELLDTQRPEFDTILCLSLTKWVHLNWGDQGLKRLFKRMYSQLRPGGKMILEAQAWPSYKRRSKITETINQNFQTLQLRPENFTEYLLSKEVGFSTCEVIGTPFHSSKGFRRPIHLFTKAETSPGSSPFIEDKKST